MNSNLPTLAGVTLPAGPLSKIEDVRQYLESIRETANIVMPVSSLDVIPPMMRVSIRPVLLDTTVKTVSYAKRDGSKGTGQAGTDVYVDKKFCKENEVAITKVGLMKLLNAAGISIVDSYRIDDGGDPLYCNWRVVVIVPQPDGRVQRQIANKVIDLRDGSPATKGLSPGDLQGQRQRITEYAESKALNRVARNSLSLQQKYDVGVLNRPFIIPVLVPDLDITDPMIKQMVAAKLLDMADSVYGSGRSHHQELPPGVGAGGEVIDVSLVDDAEDGTEDTGADIGPLPERPKPTPPPAAAATFACACPCGCQSTVSKAVHDATKREGGGPRCRECWPTKFYDTARHAALPDLGTTPKLTPAEAEAIAATKR